MTPYRLADLRVVLVGSHENGGVSLSFAYIVIIHVNSVLEKQAILRSWRQRHEPRRAAFGSAPEVTVTASHSYRALATRCILTTLSVIPGSLSPTIHLH